jgi:hypothetical protein
VIVDHGGSGGPGADVAGPNAAGMVGARRALAVQVACRPGRNRVIGLHKFVALCTSLVSSKDGYWRGSPSSNLKEIQ